jgi:hypothetical protein
MARYLTTNPVYTVTGATTLPDLIDSLFVVLSGTTYTVTMPSIPGNSGKQITFINSASGSVTLSSTANIIGAIGTPGTTYVLPANSTALLESNGSNFVVVHNQGGPLFATTGQFTSSMTIQGGADISGGAIGLSPANNNVTISPSGTGTVTISPVGTLTMNPSGAISLTGASTLTLGTAGQTTTMNGNINAAAANQTVTFSPTGTGTVSISPGGAVTMAPGSTGNINNMNIGASTRGSGSFTTLTANSTLSLTVTSGTHTISSTTASSTTGTGAVTIGGGLGVGGQVTATTLVETSSIAFKENVNPIENALETVLQLLGVTYDRKDSSIKNEVGLIAEDVYKIAPNLVSTDQNGKPYGLQYTKLTAYLIEAIKTLNAEINELKGMK